MDSFSDYVNSMDMDAIDPNLVSEQELDEMRRMDEEYGVVREIPDGDLMYHLTISDAHLLRLLSWDNTAVGAKRILLRALVVLREVLSE